MPGAIKNLVKKSLNPFIAAGIVCVVCSGFWLIGAGHWYALWPAVMAFVASPILFPLLMIPAGFCAGVMMATEKKYPYASRLFAALSFMWFVTLMAGYTAWSFAVVLPYIINDAEMLVPGVVWGIAAGLTPWALFATRDRETVFFTGLVYMAAVVAAVLFPLSLSYALGTMQIFWFYWLALGVMVGLQSLYEKLFVKPEVAPAPPAEAQAEDAPQISAANEEK